MTNSQHYHHMKHLLFWELDLLRQHSIQIQKKAIYAIVIYKLSTLLFLTFINQVQKLLMPTHCLTTIMDDFNIDMFDQLNTTK
jgi:hypothetical protein